MKLSSILSIITSLIVFASFGQNNGFQAGFESITAADLSHHLHIIASDSFEGRGTGDEGQHKAALYLAQQFEKLGLKPGNPANTANPYYQPIELVEKTWESVTLKTAAKSYQFLKDYYAYGDIQLPELTTMEIVCAGYGIEHKNYSDYKKLDVTNKAVIIFPGEPYINGVSVITGNVAPSNWANDWRAKSQLALQKGAKAVFIVVGNTDDEFYKRLYSIKEHLNKPVLGFTHKKKASAFFIPTSMAAALLKTKKEKLIAYKKSLGTNPRYPFKKSVIEAQVKVKIKQIPTENVLGLIPGEVYPEEIVVVTAHYDHLGIEDGKICYGADDDGSGTVAILELAQAFQLAAQNGQRPKRSILFMPVTGEEKGLMGSEYYTDKPVYPLSNTVADLNIDMIGRIDTLHSDKKYVYIIGSNRLSTELHDLSEKANREHAHLFLDYRYNSTDDPNRYYYRSDHYNFAKNNIPVIFYFSGIHEDYHKPTDTVDKIDFEKMVWITQLVYATLWEIANLDHKLKVDITE
ncbi:MAG: M28 family peptidase [Cytophagaceae bacterium]